ncbi:MAG: hypothetical protein AAFQ04_01680 [Pseudomonadota bacterium]
MARTTLVSIRKRKPDYGSWVAVMVMLAFIVAAAFGFVPSWVQ